MTIGEHKLEYEVLEGWERLPEGWSFVEVAGVAVEGFALYAGMNGVTLAGALGLFGSIAGFAFGRVSIKPRGTE